MPTRKELANALRILAMDAVERAESGHPGAPMGMADMAEALWRKVLRHNPANPDFVNRDRFILSNGHASMLLYGLLHLTGYDLSIDDLKNFRQMGSKTPGHPEFKHTPGVETTTGPLGQGLGMAVGMALAERTLAATFNRPGFEIVNHHTYVFLGDGCLMEGISQEACSLAGTLGLGKLIVLYDENNISIDGKIQPWFSEDVVSRFLSCNWHVIRHVDGHDGETLDAAITLAKGVHDKPSLICCKTIIGYGSPNKSGSASCHGSPLGHSECTATRILLGWGHDPFVIPQAIYEKWNCKTKGAKLEADWQALFAKYEIAYPDLASEFMRRTQGQLPVNYSELFNQALETAKTSKPMASRLSSQMVLRHLAPGMPELLGGSADLTGSVGTWHEHSQAITIHNAEGNYIHYGVREFLMGTMLNGVALHGGFIPYAGTFLVFSDYAKNALRLSALMQQRLIWILTHDSIGLGEDGPTHQPIEHLASLRLIPGMQVWRPADAVETVYAWNEALHNSGPSCLILSRQNLTPQERTPAQEAQISQGGYVLYDSQNPQALLLSTGSEVGLTMQAALELAAENISVRVVSMPSSTRFDAQPEAYKNLVLPKTIQARVAIEAASADFWWKYVGLNGRIIGMNSFGASAKASDLFPHFGFTVANIVKNVRELINAH